MSNAAVGGGYDGAVLLRPDITSAFLPTAELSLDGLVLQASTTLMSVVGLPREQLVGRPATALCGTPDDVAALIGTVEAARSGASHGEVRLALRSGDGSSTSAVTLSWSLVRDATGTPASLHSLWIGPSGALPAAQAVVAHEQRWQALLENAADITWTADSDARVISVTSGALGQLGWELSQLTGACAFDFIHPEERGRFVAAWERLVSTSSRQEVVDCRVHRADGGWTWMRETLTDLRDQPHVRAIVGNVVDITRWHHEKQARARQQAHLRARFEQSSVPQATVDVRGCLSAVNDALGRLVGQPAGMLLDQPVGVLTHPADTGQLEQALQQVLSGQRASAQAEGTVTGPSGRAVPVLADLTVLRDEQDLPAGVAMFWHDLTRLRDAEARQRQQE